MSLETAARRWSIRLFFGSYEMFSSLIGSTGMRIIALSIFEQLARGM